MSFITACFTPDHVRYDGVRPINILLLRILYFLMFVCVGFDSWTSIISHHGPWDHVRAVAFCVWAAYSTLAFFGMINPLRWLPIVIFMIFYKSLWVIIVAFPLWLVGALAGSPAAEMARIFIWAPLWVLVVPWTFVWKRLVLPDRPDGLG
ncbi:MAG: hypothetical protein WC538_21350 [Thermoanaerobaculia bacterium]